MATTLTAADLTVTITEAITLNGVDQGASNSMTIADINETYKRIQEILHTGGAQLILTFGAAPNPVLADVRYVRITNLDNANFVVLNFEGGASTDYTIRLDPAASFLIVSDAAGGGVVDYCDISGVTLEDLTSINAYADTATVPLEIFVASA